MLNPRTRLRKLAVSAFVLATAALLPGTALAQGDVASGALGYDVSFPQCDSSNPSLGQSFAVVGVTGGRPFTQNGCLGAMYGWALSGSARPQVYLNLEYGELATGQQGACADADHACKAYNFGYAAAQDAYANANAATLGGIQVASWWWLDVETMNAWNDDPGMNAQVVSGAIDFFHQGNKLVGVYSTPYQWSSIAGGFAPAEVGNWVVGAHPGDSAAALCSKPLWAGAHVWQVQWIEGSFDRDRAC